MNWLRYILGIDTQAAPPPSDSSPELAATLFEAEQMAGELQDYLRGNTLYRQISVETPLGTRRPKMTLGGLSERLEYLSEADELGPNDGQRLNAIQEAWDVARRRYADQFQEKLRREHDSYLRNWKYYLEDLARDPERWKDDYEVELRNRRRVERIRRIMGPDAPPGLVDLDELQEDWDERA